MMKARALIVLSFALAAVACRTGSPEERVYTYESARAQGDGKTPVLSQPWPAAAATADEATMDASASADAQYRPASGRDAGLVGPGEFSKHGLLEAIGECALGRYRDFLASAITLRERVNALSLSLSSGGGEIAAVRAAWAEAMTSWQEAELFRFGPAAPATASEPGGQGLRDMIYAWPLVNACYIDEQIVNQSYLSASFAAVRINGRGLAALEYLLFPPSDSNACPQFSVINANGTWGRLSAGELAQRRADYAFRASDSVVGHAEALIQAWEGKFREQLTGPGSTIYALDQDALNAVAGALFYVDYELKDLKLGRPVGIYDCLNGTCPEFSESPYAHASTANIRANLVGFRRLFQGCGEGFQGLGFDDWLNAVGAGDLASRMLAALDRAEHEAALLSAPVEQTVVVDRAKVLVMHAALKNITDLLKAEFVTVLNLELPEAREGDND